jgi:hypothetical protein
MELIYICHKTINNQKNLLNQHNNQLRPQPHQRKQSLLLLLLSHKLSLQLLLANSHGSWRLL